MSGRAFFKMSGSGNDFVFFDARDEPAGTLGQPERIRALCARGTGVGADGVVFIEPSKATLFIMRYHNADGSRAAMCGNAALCSTRLAVELGIASGAEDLRFETDSGPLTARIRDGRPEIDLPPVTEISAEAAGIQRRADERRLGFALAGVPHLVLTCEDVGRADVTVRGSELRHHPTLRDGANVDFVSRGAEAPAHWRYRTFERGVEAETLACGTGAAAVAVLLKTWGEAGEEVRLETRSGEMLDVRLKRAHDGWQPSLRGPARIVFEGRLVE